MTQATLPELMARRTTRTPDCWLWTGDTSHGYGRISYDKVRRYAHRVAYELAKGPIPDGMVIDHLCRVTTCVNPAHLEVVTIRVNTLRGESFMAKRARATHCIRDHELSGENLLVGADGRRRCRACRKVYSARRRTAA